MSAPDNAVIPGMFTEFQTLTQALAYVDTLPETDLDNHHSQRWAYGADWAETKRLAKYGWAEGAKKAVSLVSRLTARCIANPSMVSYHNAIVPDVCGSSYDMGAYLSGVPECWAAIRPVEAKKGIRIAINVTASGGVNADVIERRGVAVAALALLLQTNGYVVTLDAIRASVAPGGTEPEVSVVRIADGNTGSILDMDRMIFALAHPAMPRKVFAYTCQGYRGNVDSSRWGSMYPDASTSAPKSMGVVDLYIGSAHLNEVERWEDGGEAWVLKEYERQTKAI